jgi:hypothetical protein
MNEKLEASPDKKLEFIGADAEQLILELGVINSFKKRDVSVATTEMVVVGNNRTHWVVCAKFSGQVLSTDNTFITVCLPKSEWPEQGFKDFIKHQFMGHADTITVVNDRIDEN